MPSKEEVFEKVRAALVEALGVDDEEVKPEATLVGDLGAESIDFLDIVFRLEKSFDIKIPRGELFPEDILTNTEYVADGKYPAQVNVDVTMPVRNDSLYVLQDIPDQMLPVMQNDFSGNGYVGPRIITSVEQPETGTVSIAGGGAARFQNV